MSVRRLDEQQPDSFAFSPENLEWAKAAVRKFPDGKAAAAVLPVLWRAQEQNGGWISKPAIEYVATFLEMSYIRVYEVATFYTMFQLSPVGSRAHVQVCGTTPCMLRGSESLIEVCRRKISMAPHHLSASREFSWEEVECLGACVNAPIVQIGKDTYEDLTVETFERLLDDLAAGRPVKPGPQNGRQFSAPMGQQTTLTDPSLYGGKPDVGADEKKQPSRPAASAAAPQPAPAAASARQASNAPPAPASAEPPKYSAAESKRNPSPPTAGSPAPAKQAGAMKAARKQKASKETSPASRATPRKRPGSPPGRKDDV